MQEIEDRSRTRQIRFSLISISWFSPPPPPPPLLSPWDCVHVCVSTLVYSSLCIFSWFMCLCMHVFLAASASLSVFLYVCVRVSGSAWVMRQGHISPGRVALQALASLSLSSLGKTMTGLCMDWSGLACPGRDGLLSLQCTHPLLRQEQTLKSSPNLGLYSNIPLINAVQEVGFTKRIDCPELFW